MISFLLDIYPEVGLLDHMVVLFLIFYGSSTVSSTVAIPFSIPTNSGKGFPWQGFLLPILVIFCLFDKIYFNKCETMCHCGFWFKFSWWLVILSTFHTSVRHLSIFLWEIFIQVLCLSFNPIIWFLLLSCRNCFYVMDINHLSDMFYKYFPHSIGCLSFCW